MAQAVVVDVEVKLHIRLPFWTALKLRLAGRGVQRVAEEIARQIQRRHLEEQDDGPDRQLPA